MLFWLDSDFAKGVKQRCRHFMRIAQGGTEILVSKSLTDYIGIAAHSHLQCCIGMAEAMEYTRQSKRQRTGINQT